MNEMTPLSPTHERRLALAAHIEAMKPRRSIITMSRALTSYFRAVGVLEERGQWRTDYDSRSGIDRFAVLVDNFGHAFALAIYQRHAISREGFIQWTREFLDPEERVLAARRAETRARKAAITESAVNQSDSIALRRAINSNVDASIKARRAQFVRYLRKRRGDCTPARTYRRWRGYEEKWMQFTRVHVHTYNPDALPARYYHVKKDVAAVLGEAAVPLIFKAPLTTREELANAIEELP